MTTAEKQPVLVNGEPIQYDKCPLVARAVLRRYIEAGIYPGSGYSQILTLDLRAVLTCDDETAAAIPNILRWLVNYAPFNCYGSLEKMRDWMRERREAVNAD